MLRRRPRVIRFGRLRYVVVIYGMPRRCHGPPTGTRAPPRRGATRRFPATLHALG